MSYVVFATPTFSGSPAYEFAGAMGTAQWLLGSQGIRTAHRFHPHCQFVEVARNFLIKRFLEEHADATDLFFVDDDVGGFAPEKVVEFIARPEDIVAGLPPMKTTQGPPQYPAFLCAARRRNADGGVDPEPCMIERDGLLKAQFAPCGFMRIKRHVIERLAREAATYTFETGDAASAVLFDIFDRGALDGEFWGEDTMFCKKLIAAGYEIWVDPDVRFTHRGPFVWKGTFRTEVEKLMAGTHPMARYRDVA